MVWGLGSQFTGLRRPLAAYCPSHAKTAPDLHGGCACFDTSSYCIGVGLDCTAERLAVI